MALKKLIPTSPNANLLKGVDMTPLKTGDYNNKIRADIDAEVAGVNTQVATNTAAIGVNTATIALKANTASPTFTGAVVMPDLTPTLEVKTSGFTAASGIEYVVNSAAGIAIVLPAATAGARVTLLLQTTITSSATTITAAAGDLLKGHVIFSAVNGSGGTNSYFAPDGTNDLIITLNGSTTGGFVGDKIELVGISTTEWRVRMTATQSGTAATPFS